MNEPKIAEDKQWDGLKGYIANSKLSSKGVINNYKFLFCFLIQGNFRNDFFIFPTHKNHFINYPFWVTQRRSQETAKESVHQMELLSKRSAN